MKGIWSGRKLGHWPRLCLWLCFYIRDCCRCAG